MASSSENDAALAQLKHMHDRGIISLNELIRMSADLARPHSPTHEESSRRLWSDDDEDDLLVDESGEAFCAQVSTSASPRSPARASTPTPTYGPRTWGSGTEVQSSEYGDVTFIRLGNDADFVNNGRARIQCEKIKKGAKYKKETHIIWVKADTLSSLDDPVGIASNECSPRKSPRLQQQASAGFSSIDKESSLPCRASIERERKLPQKMEASVRGPNKLQRQTAESKISVDERVQQFPGNSLVNEMGKLRCRACNFLPANKHSSIKSHCCMGTEDNPSRHAVRLEQWSMQTDRDAELKTSIVDYFESHPLEKVGTSDPDQLLLAVPVSHCRVLLLLPTILSNRRPQAPP